MLVMPKNAPSIAAATVPEYRTLIPAFNPLLMPLTTRSGRRGQIFAKPELHAIGRASFDRPTPPLPRVEQFLDDQRAEIGDRMADAALFGGRGDDVHLAQAFQLPLQGRQSRRVDSIVVGQQNQQGLARQALQPFSPIPGGSTGSL